MSQKYRCNGFVRGRAERGDEGDAVSVMVHPAVIRRQRRGLESGDRGCRMRNATSGDRFVGKAQGWTQARPTGGRRERMISETGSVMFPITRREIETLLPKKDSVEQAKLHPKVQCCVDRSFPTIRVGKKYP